MVYIIQMDGLLCRMEQNRELTNKLRTTNKAGELEKEKKLCKLKIVC